MKVEALVPLSASVPEVELAQLPDLGRVGIMGKDALFGRFLALALQ